MRRAAAGQQLVECLLPAGSTCPLQTCMHSHMLLTLPHAKPLDCNKVALLHQAAARPPNKHSRPAALPPAARWRRSEPAAIGPAAHFCAPSGRPPTIRRPHAAYRARWARANTFLLRLGSRGGCRACTSSGESPHRATNHLQALARCRPPAKSLLRRGRHPAGVSSIVEQLICRCGAAPTPCAAAWPTATPTAVAAAVAGCVQLTTASAPFLCCLNPEAGREWSLAVAGGS